MSVQMELNRIHILFQLYSNLSSFDLYTRSFSYLCSTFSSVPYFSLLHCLTVRPPGLPDEKGRVQILNIHTNKMRSFNLLASDVDISELAVDTKNYSGAELEGLVRAAQSTAMNRHIKVRESLREIFHVTAQYPTMCEGHSRCNYLTVD